MDKAIKMLTNIKNASSVFGIRPDEIDETIAELQATQAKFESLRDYCNSAYVSYPGGYKFALGYIQARKDILTKLKQGSKE